MIYPVDKLGDELVARRNHRHRCRADLIEGPDVRI
jgi:hypothetical protein